MAMENHPKSSMIGLYIDRCSPAEFQNMYDDTRGYDSMSIHKSTFQIVGGISNKPFLFGKPANP